MNYSKYFVTIFILNMVTVLFTQTGIFDINNSNSAILQKFQDRMDYISSVINNMDDSNSILPAEFYSIKLIATAVPLMLDLTVFAPLLTKAFIDSLGISFMSPIANIWVAGSYLVYIMWLIDIIFRNKPFFTE